jgi:hypothetical protein
MNENDMDDTNMAYRMRGRYVKFIQNFSRKS